jgi:hypothetical protein
VTNTKVLPKTALTAFGLLQQSYQTAAAQLAGEVLTDAGLPNDGSWKVNWDQRQLVGPDVPDPTPADDVPAIC